jgi:hypothetical protein
VSGDAVHQPTWPLLLKIEHMAKLQVFGNNSKTVDDGRQVMRIAHLTQRGSGELKMKYGKYHFNTIANIRKNFFEQYTLFG